MRAGVDEISCKRRVIYQLYKPRLVSNIKQLFRRMPPRTGHPGHHRTNRQPCGFRELWASAQWDLVLKADRHLKVLFDLCKGGVTWRCFAFC